MVLKNEKEDMDDESIETIVPGYGNYGFDHRKGERRERMGQFDIFC